MRITFFLCLMACSLLISCSKDTTTDIENEDLSTDLDLTAKASALKLYQDYYLASASNASDVAWSGEVSSCNAGEVPQGTRDKIFMRLAYFRKAAGLHNTIDENATKSQKAQEAALMMHANGTLNHFPPNDWNCFTEAGKEAAGKSLLTSTNNASAIDSYIRDYGSENGPVGHRRWLLWPRLQEMGLGNTSNYNALWVIGDPGTPPIDAPEFIAWPPKGFVPKQLVYPRWSFSIANADFNQTTIAMKFKGGNNITVEMEELVGIYGDNTIVWRPDLNVNSLDEDTVLVVSLKDVGIDGEAKSFEYEVVLFDGNN